MKYSYRLVISCIVFCAILAFFAYQRLGFGVAGGAVGLIKMPGSRAIWDKLIQQGSGELLGWGYLFVDLGAVDTVKNSVDEGGRIILEHNTHGEENVGIYQVKRNMEPQIATKGDNALGVKYTHAKVFVRDNQAIFQTFNLTKASFEKNREFGYWTQEPNIVKGLHELFWADRNGRPLKSKSIASGLVVCPQNCYQKIVGLLSGAQHSIDIYNQYISYQPILELLERSKVKKRVILPKTDENVVQWSGSNYVKLLKEPYVHAKIIVIDQKILLISSINLSENSIRNNREIGVIVVNSGSVDQMVQWFDQDWKLAQFVK